MPILKSIVKDKYKHAMESHKWTSKEANNNLYEHFCKKMMNEMHKEFRSLVFGLSGIYDKSSNISLLEDNVLDLMASSYRVPKPSLLQKFIDFIVSLDGEYSHDTSLLEEDHCLKRHQNANYSSQGIIFSYAVAFTSGLFEPHNHFSLGKLWTSNNFKVAKNLLNGVITTESKGSAEKTDVLIKNFSIFVERLLDSVTKQSVPRLLIFLDDFWKGVTVEPQVLMGCQEVNNFFILSVGSQPCSINNTWVCCDLEEDVSKNLALVWKVMKYMMAPTSGIALEKQERQDLMRIKHFGYTLGDSHMRNIHQFVQECKSPNSNVYQFECNLFRKMFTTKGIGYTFNNEPFYKIVKNTTNNRAFFKEMYETENSDKDLPIKIPSNGKQYSLEFILILNHNLKNNGTQKLVIHDPHMIADTRYEAIDLQPGLSYEISVTPTVTVTDENALQLEPSKRSCLSGNENEALEIFGWYSQSACLFECQMKRATDKCNCTPWNYPQRSDKVNLCWHWVAKYCYEEEMKKSNLAYCDCPNDCNSIHYGVGIQTIPLSERYLLHLGY